MTLAASRLSSPPTSRKVWRASPPPVLRNGRTAFLSCLSPLNYPVDPLAFLDASGTWLGERALFCQPSQGRALVGLGTAFVQEASGPDRFRSLVTLLNAFSASLIRTDQSSFPILVGGAFNDQVDGQSTWREFPAATARVPRVLLQIDGRQAALRITVPIAPDTSTVAAEEELRALLAQAETWSQAQLQMQVPSSLLGRNGEADRSAWEDAVGDAIQLIHQQRFQKVVLAREERLEASEPFSPVATLSRLRAVDPDPTLFAVRSGESWFLGASPERLVRLSNGTVDVSCLAGSIGLGDSDDERRQLASELLRSEKDRLEHELVVGPILESLGQVCDDIERLPGTPRVVPARSVQHLETPITAHLRRPGHVLELVDRLHPTPAVGGFPRQPALQAIRALEQIERGWYAGPLGWTDLGGNGEFIVALRSALIAGTSARVLAGCGIVADSIPASEYEETRLKMRPMLAALGAM